MASKHIFTAFKFWTDFLPMTANVFIEKPNQSYRFNFFRMRYPNSLNRNYKSVTSLNLSKIGFEKSNGVNQPLRQYANVSDDV